MGRQSWQNRTILLGTCVLLTGIPDVLVPLIEMATGSGTRFAMLGIIPHRSIDRGYVEHSPSFEIALPLGSAEVAGQRDRSGQVVLGRRARRSRG